MYDYLDLRQIERLQELVPYKALAPDADEIIKELDRLNNIINELEKWYEQKWNKLMKFKKDKFYNVDYAKGLSDGYYKLQELKEE